MKKAKSRSERHYWCGGCLAYRPAHFRRAGRVFGHLLRCPDGHDADESQWIDWTFPYAGGSEKRV